jgi:hypothetical protein
MANFICICNECAEKLKDKAILRGYDLTNDEIEEGMLFQTSHSINATQDEIIEALICPRCDGKNCEKTLLGYDIVGYVRGDGYLDVSGCKRDMNLFHLTQDDPYAEYRLPGETEEMKTQIKMAGRHKLHKKHFDVSAVDNMKMREAIVEAASFGPVESAKPSIQSE